MIHDSSKEEFFTLENLKELQDYLEAGSSADFSGNVKKAMRIDSQRREMVHTCRRGCIDRGLIELTAEELASIEWRKEKEKLELKLDLAFPNAQSKEVVDFEGKRYQRCFTPLRMSNSRKNVIEWLKSWKEIPSKLKTK
ncbi:MULTISPECIES: hypothetical protein [unclassified Enterobacter]|uniref:hypothetical protein n=1 Tax=unclassified Enterobacter TaxID=2608935 RepID=UPI000F46E398|nr:MULTISPECIES: hypothetical protein [unclassified Enterobacter]